MGSVRCGYCLLALAVSSPARYGTGMLAAGVLLNAGATSALWQRVVRRPEKLKKKFRNRLWESKPITPKHEPPPPLERGYGVGKAELQFFSDFEDFANVVNSWLTAPYVYPHGNSWRLQELPKSELLHLGGEGPTYGRTYAVFHNQVRIGEIEIKPHYGYSTERPRVEVYVQLDWVRLLHFGTIRGFLIDIAQHVSETGLTLEWLHTIQAIDVALLGVLWKTQEVSRFGMDDEPSHGEIEMEFGGLATSYLHSRETRRKETDSPQAVPH
jgi:hypothetical protein